MSSELPCSREHLYTDSISPKESLNWQWLLSFDLMKFMSFETHCNNTRQSEGYCTHQAMACYKIAIRCVLHAMMIGEDVPLFLSTIRAIHPSPFQPVSVLECSNVTVSYWPLLKSPCFRWYEGANSSVMLNSMLVPSRAKTEGCVLSPTRHFCSVL